MKTRNGLLFALCALMGAAGFTACSESGSNEEIKGSLTVSESNLSMHVGEVQSFTVSYEANKVVSVVSDDEACVTVTSSVNTGANNEGNVEVKAEKEDCKAIVTVSVDGAEKNVKVTVEEGVVPFISVSPASITLNASEEGKVTATFAEGSSPKSGENLQIANGNPSCVEVADVSNATSASGKVDIKVNAKAVTSNCDAEITVSKPAGYSANVDSQTFTVHVIAGSAGDDEPENAVLEFVPASISVDPTNDKGVAVELKYYTTKGGLADKSVTFTNGDDSCFTAVSKSKTNDDGIISVTIKPNKNKKACKAKLTASADTSSTELDVEVAERTVFDLTSVKIEATNKYDKMGYVSFIVLNGVDCETAMANYNDYADFSLSEVEPQFTTGDAPEVYTYRAKDDNDIKDTITGLSEETNKGIFAFAAVSDSSSDEIVGYGCTPISKENDYGSVTVNLQPLPINVSGSYSVITNFDLTSSFTASDKLPYVEKMEGGDWIKFVADLFQKPVDTLYEFLWQNTVARLNQIPGLSDLKIGNWNVGSLISGLIDSDVTKSLGLAYVKPLLDEYLKGKDGNKSWYDILLQVSPDVEDLVRNMQLKGTIKIDDTNPETPNLIESASEEFTELQYRWSYSDKPCTYVNTYTQDGVKRCSMKITSANNTAIKGDWTGTVVDEDHKSAGDADLNINDHALSFKWASILYAAVFKTILPTIFDYKVTDDDVITQFMNKILFEAIVSKYKADYEGQTVTKDGKTKTFPELQIKVAADYPGKADNYVCGQFIESIVYMIAADSIEGWKKVIPTVAKYACDDGIGALDSLVWEQLGKIEAGTENGIMLSASDCALYDEGTVEYTKMGEPDDKAPTANSVFSDGSKTTRCEYNLNVGADKPMKGLFHATRKD